MMQDLQLGVVSLCLLTALCTGYRSVLPGATCPERICTCSDSQQRPTQPSNLAICKEMPRQRLPSTVNTLQVNGSVPAITKNMIRLLGGELLVLDLSGCNIRSIEPGSFDAAPKLTTLKLSNNQLQEIGPAAFKGNRMLRELFLDGNKLKRVEAAFSKLDQLRELHLERNELTQFPSKLPVSLAVLNISHNNIGPTFESDMHETNLKTLDLCGNHLGELSETTLRALNKLQHLCLGDGKVSLPENTARNLPHITSLSLVASANQEADLDAITQTQIQAMATLTSLSLVHYRVDSLSCLTGLDRLRHLELKNISTSADIDVESIMLPHTSLTVLSLESSPDLALALLYKRHVLGQLNRLEKLNLRRTSITYLPKLDVPHTDHFQLDISQNPLVCDCQFAWVLEKQQTKGVPNLLLNMGDTVCTEPQQFRGKLLVGVIKDLDCGTTVAGQETTVSTSNVDQSVVTDPVTVGGGEEQAETTSNPGDMGGVDPDNLPSGEGGQGGQEVETTPGDLDPYSPESMPVGNGHKDGEDNYNVLYIVLGCLLVILILVGIILAIFYWHFKRMGSNKVTPETSQVPAEQSFQQLQQTEETSLVKDVKKYSQE